MPLDFLLTNSPQMDILRPGNTAVRNDRCGASQSRFQRADSEDAGSFDTALESARVRQETTGPPSSDGKEVDSVAKTSGHSRKNRPDSSEPDNQPEDGCTAQESQSSDAEGMATDPTTLSTGDKPSAGDVSMGLETASDPAAESTVSQPVSASSPSSDGDRYAGGLVVDAATSTPASPGGSEPTVAVAACQEDGQTAVDPAEAGKETKAFQETDTEKPDPQASAAKAQAPATMAIAPAADVAIDATTTDAAVKTDAARSEKNRHQNRVEKDTGGLTEKSSTPSTSASGRGDSLATARAGGFSSAFNETQSGDDLSQKFGNGAGRDLEAYRGEPQVSEKGAERPSWSTSALKTDAGGYQESTGVTTAKPGTESEQKVADMLLAPQRAVNGAGEATAATETGETHHPKDLRAETLGQIVDKAVFRLRNGQSEVRIDLKPDSLGHVRLQIVTENHQVSLRIMAESHAAKNLIDSGIGQLKADLQAQGLRVDELEVSVANEFSDFNRHSAFSDRAAQARRVPSAERPYFQETAPAAVLKPAMGNPSTAGVDCFV
ncbi:MAG: flagellar hook-length control protein FliK [Desulfobacterales bacterium]